MKPYYFNRHMKNSIFIICFLYLIVSGFQTAQAGDISFSKTNWRKQIVAGTTPLVVPVVYPYQADDKGTSVIATRTARVRLYYPNNNSTDVSTLRWRYKVSYSVVSNGTNPTTVTGTVEIVNKNISGNESYIFEDIQDYPVFDQKFKDDATTLTMTITNVEGWKYDASGNETPLSNLQDENNPDIPKDIALDFSVFSKRYTLLSPSATSTMSYDATNKEIKWQYIDGAEEYDLEWVFIDYNSTLSISTPADAFNAKEGIRVTVTGNKYPVGTTFPRGSVYYRVRPVGRYVNKSLTESEYLNNVRYKVNGTWSYLISPVTVSTTTQLEAGRTWSYLASYAEEGKQKVVVSYYDGSLRQRQALTNLSSDNTTLVATDVYDHDGRAAVQIMPFPVANSGNPFVFQEGSNKVGGHEFTEDDFENTSSQPALDNTGGVSKYYSVNNPMTDSWTSYIPDAAGYVYSQTVFTDDNTGRPSKVGGLSYAFRLGSGLNTEYKYMQAKHEELKFLFGETTIAQDGKNVTVSKIGNASNFTKVIMNDNNNQTTVTYKDKYGRTVATGLSGDKPVNMASVPLYARDDAAINLNSNVSINKDKIESVNETKFYFPMPTGVSSVPVTFQYSLVPLNTSVTYNVTLTVYDPDNIPFADQTITVQGLTMGSFTPYTFTKDGDYRVIKKITVNKASMEEVITNSVIQYINTQQGLSLTTLDDLKVNIANNIPPSTGSCGVSFTDPGLSYTIDHHSPCSSYVTQMKSEVSPPAYGGSSSSPYYTYSNGQYLITADFRTAIAARMSSTFTPADQRITLVDANSVTITQTEMTNGYNVTANWVKGWEEQLIKAHLEFCHIAKCSTIADYAELEDTYYKDRLALQTSWSTALSNGYIDPFDILTHPSTITTDCSTLSVGSSHAPYVDGSLSGLNGAAASLTTKLQTYKGQTGVNIWQAVDKAICNLSPAPADPDAEKWKMFRSAYLGAVQQTIREVVYSDATCPFITGGLVKDTKYDLSVDEVKGTMHDNELLIKQACEDNCTVAVTSWMQKQSEQCGFNWNDYPIEKATIINILTKNCRNNCNSNPYTTQNMDISEIATYLQFLPCSTTCTTFVAKKAEDILINYATRCGFEWDSYTSQNFTDFKYQLEYYLTTTDNLKGQIIVNCSSATPDINYQLTQADFDHCKQDFLTANPTVTGLLRTCTYKAGIDEVAVTPKTFNYATPSDWITRLYKDKFITKREPLNSSDCIDKPLSLIHI